MIILVEWDYCYLFEWLFQPSVRLWQLVSHSSTDLITLPQNTYNGFPICTISWGVTWTFSVLILISQFSRLSSYLYPKKKLWGCQMQWEIIMWARWFQIKINIRMMRGDNYILTIVCWDVQRKYWLWEQQSTKMIILNMSNCDF